MADKTSQEIIDKLNWRTCSTEEDLQTVIKMMQRDLSEPYPIWTYRHFLHQWPQYCLLAELDGKVIGSIVSKLAIHKKAGPTG